MWIFRPKVNEGVHIEGKGVSIDIIVVAKGGSRRSGEACLEIIGVDGVDKMCLAPSEKLVHLGYDIYLGIFRREMDDSKTNEEVISIISYDKSEKQSERIEITYDIPRDFKWELRKYR